MIVRGFNGIIDFPRTNLFLSEGLRGQYFIVPLIKNNKFLVNINEPFAVYGSRTRADEVLDDIIRQWAKGVKIYELPRE